MAKTLETGAGGLYENDFYIEVTSQNSRGNAVLLYLQYYFLCNNTTMAKQKLSLKARIAKKKRDLAAAKTADRRKKKAENQRRRRKAKRDGKNIKGKDYDHKDKKFKSVKANRGNDGKGTKREG